MISLRIAIAEIEQDKHFTTGNKAYDYIDRLKLSDTAFVILEITGDLEHRKEYFIRVIRRLDLDSDCIDNMVKVFSEEYE